jgi:16S rRNA (adenine1518-N6/adenine1519-N6)-dimethyltransferase
MTSPDAAGRDPHPPFDRSPDLSPTGPSTDLPTSPAALLRRLGLRPRKRFSQSFLVDANLPDQIARAADLVDADQVLEIGPGLGILTRALARRAARVVAVELDRDLAAALPRLVPANVAVIAADALAFDPADHFAGSYKLVANLPYNVTTPVLLRYLDVVPRPALLVVMVQKEVAERIAAGPGRRSYLTVAVQSAASARIVRLVSPGAFFPRPKVDSALLRLDPLPTRLVPDDRRAPFLRLVQAGFAQPRKQLANSLAQGLARPKSERRPQDLELAEWRALFELA